MFCFVLQAFCTLTCYVKMNELHVYHLGVGQMEIWYWDKSLE
jgi:hypothetical protein